jgi:predicted phage tail protein
MVRLNYIKNTLDLKGRKITEVKFIPTWNVKDYLQDNDLPTKDIKIVISGKTAKFNSPINNGDEILIYPCIGWEAIGALIVWAFAYAAANAFYIGMAALVIGYAIYSVCSAPKAKSPSYGTSDSGSIADSSPTYGWDGVQTTQAVGLPIPIIYGEHMVGGNIINAFVSDNGDKAYLNILLALCNGEIDSVGDIFINDNPIVNFSDIVVEKKYGTNDQTVIANFGDLHNAYNVGANLLKADPYVYTTKDSDVEGFDIAFRLSSGLFYTNSSNGSIGSWAVTYQVEYSVAGEDDYTDLGTVTIDACSRTAIRRTFSKRGLAAGQYDIRITKTSDDPDFYHVGDLTLYSVDEIKTDDLAYPNTALIGFKLLATDQLSGSTPNITSIVKGTKVSQPKIMNGAVEVAWEDYYWDPAGAGAWKLLVGDTPLTWDGTTFVTKWCASPAWCLKDLLTSTLYGLGEFITIAHIDDVTFLEIAKWCDEKVPDGLGGYEKRMRFDVVIDSATRAIDMIMQLCSAFRGMPFYSNGTIKLRVDKPELPVQLFGMGNIVQGSFQQQWRSNKDIATVIEVQYLDKDKNYEQQRIACIDEAGIAEGAPIRKRGIQIFTTRVSQALREGRYAMLSNKHVDQSISFKAMIDAVAIEAGDVIAICHDLPQWGFSGRIKAGSTDTIIILDNEVTVVTGFTYKLQVRFADDTIEERTVDEGAGSYSTLHVTPAFSNAPAGYDIFAFGKQNILVKPFRVMALQRDGQFEVTIQAVEHNASVYDDSAVVIPNDNYSDLNKNYPVVTNVKLSERLTKLSDGTIEDVIDVAFEPPDRGLYVMHPYSKARVYLSDNDGASWLYKGETLGDGFSIVGGLTDGVTYKVAVVSVTIMSEVGIVNNAPCDIITLVGKSAPPADITSFLVNQSRDRLYFGWGHVADVDLAGYEIRYGDSWEVGSLVVSGVKNNSHIKLDFKEGAAQSFWIKAIDTSGNCSATAKEAVITIDNIPFKNIIQSYSEQTAWAGTKTDLSKVGDNLEIDAGHLFGTYETAVRDVGYVATFKIGIDSVVVDASDEEAWEEEPVDGKWSDLADTDRWSGQELTGAATFEIKTSEDNVNWSAYAPWQAGDYRCRSFQLKMTLAREDEGKVIQCSELNTYADLPDVDEMQDGEVATAGDGCDITFVKTFHENPALNITILTGLGIAWQQTGLDTTGVNIKLYKLDGTAVTGTFRIHIHGV